MVRPNRGDRIHDRLRTKREGEGGGRSGKGGPAALAFVAIIAALGYYYATPTEMVGTETAHMVRLQQSQRPPWRVRRMAEVAFADGSHGKIPLPRHIPYDEGAEVTVSVHQRAWPPKIVNHRFEGYVE